MPFHALLVSFTIQKSDHVMINISWRGCSKCAAQHLQITYKRSEFEANLINAMGFASAELFSVTYVTLLLRPVRKCKTQHLSNSTQLLLILKHLTLSAAPDDVLNFNKPVGF